MNKTELLAPAGSFEVGKAALYAGCDAIYLALDTFGARAYAKNFTKDELVEILNIAHALDKKVYVTVNTNIKNSELDAVYKFLDEIYLLGVDAVICADIAVFMYIINNLPNMGCHISTQVGVKDLYDTLFFESIKADRVVLAREDSIEQIKHIKQNTNIELEVFIHGALCVSYSGGCLFSSLLSLRSGNRGRCSQNCRREYILHENGKPISKPAFYLSMKDLCVGNNVTQLIDSNIDSLKIEGRMKNISYVDVITRYYRSLIDRKEANFDEVNQIFHRKFTKGFIFNEDRKNIATITDSSSVGRMVGKVIRNIKDKIVINSNVIIRKNERLRFSHNEESTYLTVTNIYVKDKLVDEAIGQMTLSIDNTFIKENSTIYKMNDTSLSEVELDSNKVPLNLFVTAHLDNKLMVTVNFKDEYFTIESNSILTKALKNPLSEETIYKQLNKLTDTPFYIESISYDILGEVFISLSEINEVRRKIVDYIYQSLKEDRIKPNRNQLFLKKRNVNISNSFIAHVKTNEQYEACKKMGIETIFYKNISPYVNSKYTEIKDAEVLVSNYGGLYHYTNKIITTDYSFNVMNKDSILHLLNLGASNVTLSYEVAFNELKELSNDFYNTYGMKAPIDYIIYGKQKLMTMKYCPLKAFGLCGKCRNNKYHLVDKLGSFLVLTKEDCYVEIYNELPLNLIEEIKKVAPYVNRFRFEFTTETYEEVVNIIENATKSLIDDSNKFSLKKQTKGYFKRSIL